MRLPSTLIIAGSLLLTALALPCVPVLGEEAAPEQTADEVRQWVTQLNSGRFIERERATSQLIKAGARSIEPLVRELPTASPEAIARGMHVLTELALVPNDLQLSEQSWKAIEQLATQHEGAIGRRATDSLASLHSLRQQRARDLLVRSGAKVTDRHGQIGGMIVTMVYAVEIPEEFTGDLDTMRQIRWLEEVRQVTLRGEQITDEWLAPLAELKELIVLEVKHTKVTDAGLKPLKALPSLAYLSVYYSPVTDGSIELMGSLKTLTEVRLFGTNITPAGAQQLQQALTLATIDFRQGAFLGVGCQTHPDGAQISIMHDESAADKAGMRSGDVIQWFNDKPVANFDDLRAAIANHPAGNEVKIKALRAGQSMEFTVKLGEWE